jgi:hypothetical protein
VSIRDHLRDHVLAGFSVVLDVNEPWRLRIGLSMLRSLTLRRHDNSLCRVIRCLLDYEQIGFCSLLLRSCRLHNRCASDPKSPTIDSRAKQPSLSKLESRITMAQWRDYKNARFAP